MPLQEGSQTTLDGLKDSQLTVARNLAKTKLRLLIEKVFNVGITAILLAPSKELAEGALAETVREVFTVKGHGDHKVLVEKRIEELAFRVTNFDRWVRKGI